MVRPELIAIILILLSQNTLGMNRYVCLNAEKGIVEEKPHRFTPNLGTPHPPLPEFPEDSTSFLNKGNVGSIYRFGNSKGKIRTLKVYRDFKRGWDRETETWREFVSAKTSRDNDVALMTLLREHGQLTQCRIAKVEKVEAPERTSPVMEVETVEGKDVLSLLRDDQVSNDLKEEIYERYVSALKEFSQIFGVKVIEVPTTPKFDSTLTAESLPRIDCPLQLNHSNGSLYTHIHLTADGMIVDSRTVELVIVDVK